MIRSFGARLLRLAPRVAVALCVLAVVLALGALLVWIVNPAIGAWLVWKMYVGYVDVIANATGWSPYLVTALALIAFIPFYYGATFVIFHPFDRRKRTTGFVILVVMAVAYNGALYAATRNTTFDFTGGVAHKWYAITPAGVRYYPRPGVDPEYGIPLQPMTPEKVRHLELLAKGAFVAVDPARVQFFNPITGAPELWVYEHDDGAMEFYAKPGFHPGTGVALRAVTRETYLKWRRAEELAAKKREEDAKRLAAEARKNPPTTWGFKVRPDESVVYYSHFGATMVMPRR